MWAHDAQVHMLVLPAQTANSDDRVLTSCGTRVNQEDLRTVGKLIEAGKLTPVIDRTYPLVEAPEALRYLEQGHPAGKVVITI
jgi:NADPH:quinone reductase-like Zn-dependent oxidoreductase